MSSYYNGSQEREWPGSEEDDAPRMNPYQLVRRQQKVFKIVPVLIRLGAPADEIELNINNENFWTIMANELKIFTPSLETRKMCVEKLREHQEENGV